MEKDSNGQILFIFLKKICGSLFKYRENILQETANINMVKNVLAAPTVTAMEKNWTLSPQVKSLSVWDVCTNNIVCTNFFSWLYSLIVNYCIPWFHPKFARLNPLKASDVKASTLKKSEMNPSCSITFLQCQKCCELVLAIATLEPGNIGHLQWMLYLGHKFENC